MQKSLNVFEVEFSSNAIISGGKYFPDKNFSWISWFVKKVVVSLEASERSVVKLTCV